MTKNIGVVIPFYQREKGILVKALNSISNQSADVVFTIVIVDDESPVSAESEISSVQLRENCKIELIKQKNAGPAAARNKALDYLAAQAIPVVAFLDSDDIWDELHVQMALQALDKGASFYFCDHSRFEEDYSWFNHLDCFKEWGKTIKEYKIELYDQFAELSGKDCFRLFLTDYLSQTSSVVYDFDKHRSARFDVSLVSAGEDFFLWLQLALSSEKVIFSLYKGLHCGEGVNIYFDAFDWSKLASSSQQGYRYLLYYKILTNFSLSKQQASYIKVEIVTFSYRYSYLMLKHLITGKGLDKKLLIKLWNITPLIVFSIPIKFIKVLFNKRLLGMTN